MMNQLGIFAVILLSVGCVFGGGDNNPSLGGGDTGRDGSVDEPDTSAIDASPNNVTPDMRARDEGTPDLGRPDLGSDMARPDLGAPDMQPPPEPYVVVESHVVALGGTPSTTAPTEVAEFASGFLVGYVDGTTDQAVFGWYSSDSPNVLDTANDDADVEALDLATTSMGGFAVYMSNDTLRAARFVPTVLGAPQFAAVYYFDTTATSTTKRELVATIEADTVYTLFNPIVTSANNPRLNVGLVDDTGWGFASTATLDSFDMRGIEVVGGERGVGRQLFGTGILGGNYRLVDYIFDINVSMSWTIEQYGCGSAPSDARIIPFDGHWTLLEAPNATGSRLDAVECTPVGNPLVNRLTVIAPNDEITDFDIAKEDLKLGSEFGVAWVDGDVPMFAQVFADTSTNTVVLQDTVVLPGAADRIRVAYNSTRDQWGVVTTSAGVSSRLFILESNPNL